jgi:hypothetical protein
MEQSGGLEPPWVSRQFTKLLLSPLSQPCLNWSLDVESNHGHLITNEEFYHYTIKAQNSSVAVGVEPTDY